MLPFGINYEDENEARCIYESIIEKIKNSNRFFIDDSELKLLYHLFADRTSYIEEKSVFYRAREYDEVEDKKEGKEPQFEGYDAKGSFINFESRWPTDNRMNPQGIYVLYCASDIETCITELKPYVGGEYSVATLIANKRLKIVDLSKKVIPENEQDVFLSSLCKYVVGGISKGNGGEDYVFPQFLAGYCKHCGFDGLAYRSKYSTFSDTENGKGVNYSIFSYDKCDVVSSKLYDVNNITIEIDRTNIF